jgi:hypothetical protein
VLKTIVAFLNGSGGRLLVGGLERSRYQESLIKYPDLFEEWPSVGEWIIPGVNPEYEFTKNLDGFVFTVG